MRVVSPLGSLSVGCTLCRSPGPPPLLTLVSLLLRLLLWSLECLLDVPVSVAFSVTFSVSPREALALLLNEGPCGLHPKSSKGLLYRFFLWGMGKRGYETHLGRNLSGSLGLAFWRMERSFELPWGTLLLGGSVPLFLGEPISGIGSRGWGACRNPLALIVFQSLDTESLDGFLSTLLPLSLKFQSRLPSQLFKTNQCFCVRCLLRTSLSSAGLAPMSSEFRIGGLFHSGSSFVKLACVGMIADAHSLIMESDAKVIVFMSVPKRLQVAAGPIAGKTRSIWGIGASRRPAWRPVYEAWSLVSSLRGVRLGKVALHLSGLACGGTGINYFLRFGTLYHHSSDLSLKLIKSLVVLEILGPLEKWRPCAVDHFAHAQIRPWLVRGEESGDILVTGKTSSVDLCSSFWQDKSEHLESFERQDWISCVWGTSQDAMTSHGVTAVLAVWYPNLVKPSLAMLCVHPLLKLVMAMNDKYNSTAAEILAEGMENTWSLCIASEIPRILLDILFQIEHVNGASAKPSHGSYTFVEIRVSLVELILPMSLMTLIRVTRGSPRNLAPYLDKYDEDKILMPSTLGLPICTADSDTALKTASFGLSFSPDGEELLQISQLGLIAFSEHGLIIRWWSLGSMWWEKLSRNLVPVQCTKLIFVPPWEGFSPTSTRSSVMASVMGNGKHFSQVKLRC
ncbi:hypothetical protein Tco_0990298 [Tanacetum coccineum]|uniref:Uncharacterized protein n=1 Tax=Tanacetum coccineum TaxID=301880 RepID=A0ABQ5EWH1_9ASTR